MEITGQTHLLEASQLNGVEGGNLFPVTVFDAVINPETNQSLNATVKNLTAKQAVISITTTEDSEIPLDSTYLNVLWDSQAVKSVFNSYFLLVTKQTIRGQYGEFIDIIVNTYIYNGESIAEADVKTVSNWHQISNQATRNPKLLNCIKLNNDRTAIVSFASLRDALEYMFATYFTDRDIEFATSRVLVIVTSISNEIRYYRYSSLEVYGEASLKNLDNWVDVFDDIRAYVNQLSEVMGLHVSDLYEKINNSGTYHFEIPASIGAQDLQSAILYVSQNVSDWSAATFDNTKANIRNVLFVGFIDSTSNAYVQYRIDLSASNNPYTDLQDTSNWNQLI